MAHEMMILALQFGLILIVAKLSGWFFSTKLKQSQVLGELVAGMLIGPYVLGAIPLGSFGPFFPLTGGSTIPVSTELYAISTIGSVFLLFNSGLETDLPTFLKFSGKATIVGLGGVVVSFFMGAGLTVLLHPEIGSIMAPEALFLGTLCTATSIGITARILSDSRKISTPEGVTILAAAVLDDVLSIILLSVVVGIATVEMGGGTIAWSSIAIIGFKAIGFWLICMVLGIVLAPHLTQKLKKLESLSSLAIISFGFSLLLAGLSEMAGLAMIIGAYISGLALSQTDVAGEINERIKAVSEYFVPVFFAVMGMMVDFKALMGVFVFGILFSIFAFLGKLIGCGFPALFVGFNLRGAARIGAGMLPRGEVTLIVAGIGLSSGAIGADMFGVAVMTMLLASFAAPPIITQTFKGGSGYKEELGKDKEEQFIAIELEFPSERTADYLRRSLASAFRGEGFFISSIEGSVRTWQIRKEQQVFIMRRKGSHFELSVKPQDENFARLMLFEALVEFQEFADSLKRMQEPEMMGAKLLMDMFAEEDSKSK
jgi:Kef-type K+ transport system membrane component KefB